MRIVFVIDPLGDRLHAKVAGKNDQRANEQLVFPTLRKTRDKAAVDNEKIDDEGFKLAEGRVHRAKVIQGELSAEGFDA